jgi:hypothetical protein
MGQISIEAQNYLAQAVKLLAIIRNALDSNLSQDNEYPNCDINLSQLIICKLTSSNHFSENMNEFDIVICY